MNGLLDTQSLIWAVLSPRQLSRRAREMVADRKSVIYVSAASAGEIATKVRIGKLPEAEKFERVFLQTIFDAGYRMRAITVEDGLRAGRLVGTHKDPFDRMIVAQALADDIPVISNDEKLDAFGVRRTW